MAENNKKENKILSIFVKEYKYEGLVLLGLALVAIVLGIMVLVGEYSNGANGLTVNPNVFLIGTYPTAFAWVLVILGVFSAIVAVWPIYKPSIFELKRVSWTKKGDILKNSLTVFGFIVVMATFFLVADIAFGYLVEFFHFLSSKF